MAWDHSEPVASNSRPAAQRKPGSPPPMMPVKVKDAQGRPLTGPGLKPGQRRAGLPGVASEDFGGTPSAKRAGALPGGPRVQSPLLKQKPKSLGAKSQNDIATGVLPTNPTQSQDPEKASWEDQQGWDDWEKKNVPAAAGKSVSSGDGGDYRNWVANKINQTPTSTRSWKDSPLAKSTTGAYGNNGPRANYTPNRDDDFANEALPARRQADAGISPMSNQRRRNPSNTQQMANPDAHPTGAASPKATQGETLWDVSVPGDGVYRVAAQSAEHAKMGLVVWFAEDQEQGQSKRIDPTQLTVQQAPRNTDTKIEQFSRLRDAVRDMVREVVRKKEGGGGYVLYGPNKGKKKAAKPAGEFPTRLAAKRAELARFPPKDADQLKKARTRLDKLNKDPEKRAAAERDDLSGRKKPKRTGTAKGARKRKTESFIQMMTQDLSERLFREEEVPGSAWDERISTLNPEMIASDKRLASLHKMIERGSMAALGEAQKGLARAMRGLARVDPGDISFDPQRRKTFMSLMLDVDGSEIGPIHLYVDGGHVKIEISQEARGLISEMDPDDARDFRGALMSFQEDVLPKIDVAKKAWGDRDSYLDKLHSKMDKQVGGMSGVEMHLMKQLFGKRRK